MPFYSINFWLFFIPVLIITHILPHRKQNIFLVAASYAFYGLWDWRFLLLLFGSTIIPYLLVHRTIPDGSNKHRILFLIGIIVVNLGALLFFKYYNFFVESFMDVFNVSTDETSRYLFNVVLPVGISFYTFSAMSYAFEVYSGRITPVRSFIDFALYVSFFPKLLAGPIERGNHLIPQIVQERRIDPSKMESACHLIAWGLFKKVCIADALVHPVNVVYSSASPTGPEIYIATLAFAIQIYCDFSGYTDMASGMARLFGFALVLNFNLPYFSKHPSDFWGRWHISLSSWFRDYIYIPLGGSRRGTLRTLNNLIITMGLCGLWHGARYNFILWGIYHGFMLCIYRINSKIRKTPIVKTNRLFHIIKIIITFHIVLFGWLLFRVESMGQLTRMIGTIIFCSWGVWGSAMEIIRYIFPVLLPLVLYESFQLLSGNLEVINKAFFPARAIFFGFCIASVIFIRRGDMPFIYFKF